MFNTYSNYIQNILKMPFNPHPLKVFVLRSLGSVGNCLDFCVYLCLSLSLSRLNFSSSPHWSLTFVELISKKCFLSVCYACFCVVWFLVNLEILLNKCFWVFVMLVFVLIDSFKSWNTRKMICFWGFWDVTCFCCFCVL